jgi:hypothetical protein
MSSARDSPEKWRRGVEFVDYAAPTNGEKIMDTLAALEIGATAVLLIAHLVIVVRNRFGSRA